MNEEQKKDQEKRVKEFQEGLKELIKKTQINLVPTITTTGLFMDLKDLKVWNTTTPTKE